MKGGKQSCPVVLPPRESWLPGDYETCSGNLNSAISALWKWEWEKSKITSGKSEDLESRLGFAGSGYTFQELYHACYFLEFSGHSDVVRGMIVDNVQKVLHEWGDLEEESIGIAWKAFVEWMKRIRGFLFHWEHNHKNPSNVIREVMTIFLKSSVFESFEKQKSIFFPGLNKLCQEAGYNIK